MAKDGKKNKIARRVGSFLYADKISRGALTRYSPTLH
jgi:hypothetical protein